MTDPIDDTQAQQAMEKTKVALEEAISTIKTPEQADQVIADLQRVAGAATEKEVAAQQPAPADSLDAANKIEAVAEETPPHEKPQAVIAEAAAQIAAAQGESEEVLSQAVHQVTNPNVHDIKQPETIEERRLLKEALLRRLNPVAAADTTIFLLVNELPHTPLFNAVMQGITASMNRGDAWVIMLLIATLFDHKRGRRALLEVLPPLWLATATVEYPIKGVFRRRRPFIEMVRAIVIGKKPGGYSFPSGHSAAAFAGAVLISHHYPRWATILYLLAALVGFSRIYLGVHYPGDVLTGGISGISLASGYRYLIAQITEAID